MARIRTIKPEFPQSETIGSLSRDARLLFVQLWTVVDDDGRARAPSRMLASLLYPYDDDAPTLIESWLGELEEAGCIRRYQVDGHHFLDIPKWLEHQKIDHPKPSKHPAFTEPIANVREASRISAPDPRTIGPRMGTKEEDLITDDGARAPEISQAEELELREAAGEAFNAASPNILVMREPMRWLQAGMDFRLDVLPAVRDTSSRARAGKVFDWNYYSQPIADWHERRTAPMPKGVSSTGPPRTESLASKVLQRMQNHDDNDRSNQTIELTAARLG